MNDECEFIFEDGDHDEDFADFQNNELMDCIYQKYGVGDHSFLFKNMDELKDIFKSLYEANYLKYELNFIKFPDFTKGVVVISTYYDDWSTGIPERHMLEYISLDNIIGKIK